MAEPSEEGIVEEVGQNEVELPKKRSKGLLERLARAKIREGIGKAAKKYAGKLVMLFKKLKTKLVSLLRKAFPPALIIICTIGIISFIVNMPGIVRGKINEIFKDLADDFVGFFIGDDQDLKITDDQKKELLQYIDDMGIDVVGFGFAVNVVKDQDGEIDRFDEELANYVSPVTKMLNLRLDKLYAYLYANERIYIRKDAGAINFIGDDSSSGMLNIDSGFGETVTVDKDNKVLNIVINDPTLSSVLQTREYSFSLEGWAGRYGIPLEFSMALHLATMSSGMVEELITHPDLQTQVNIGIDEAECEMSFEIVYVNENGETIEIPYNAPTGKSRDLLDKINNGEEIKEEDLSVEGLYNAYNEINYSDYTVVNASNVYEDYDATGDVKGITYISGFLETMGALISDRAFAVQITETESYSHEDANSDSQHEDYTENLSSCISISPVNTMQEYIPVFFRKAMIRNTTYNPKLTSITLNSGAFICQYDEDGNNPDETTGKLNRILSTENVVWDTETLVPEGKIKYVNITDTVGDNGDAIELENETNSNKTGEVYKQVIVDGSETIIEEGETNCRSVYEVIPTGESTVAAYIYDVNNDSELDWIVSKKAYGLGEFSQGDINSEFNNNALYSTLNISYDEYYTMLKEIDWFIATSIYYNYFVTGDWDEDFVSNLKYCEGEDVKNVLEDIAAFFGRATTTNEEGKVVLTNDNTIQEADFGNISKINYYSKRFQKIVKGDTLENIGNIGYAVLQEIIKNHLTEIGINVDAIIEQYGYSNYLDIFTVNYGLENLDEAEKARMNSCMENMYGNSGLYTNLCTDYEKICEKSINNKDREETILNALEAAGYEGFTQEVVDYLYLEYQGTEIGQTQDVKYAQPYIESVVKHWFKDIKFTYEENTETIELNYNGEVEGIEVHTVLKPKENIIAQDEDAQPYVIKGDLVLLDGEVYEGTLTEYAEGGFISDYQWGDGYRTTKKIFTKGRYYTYDGTEDTAKSIYFQEMIEDLGEDAWIQVSVISERIDGLRIIKTNNIEFVDGTGADVCIDKNKNGELEDGERIDRDNEIGDDYESYFENLASEKISSDSEDTIIEKIAEIDAADIYYTGSTPKASTNELQDWYVIHLKQDINYISPVEEDDTTEEEVTVRADIINQLWENIGVSCQRQPLSFDNTSSDGQVMSTTGLAILKNAKTEDADYIYRNLKEMLIELGYYTEAEFDYLESDKLTWLIPEYNPDTWPQNKDEDDLEFGAILYPFEEPVQDDASDNNEDNSTDNNAENNNTQSSQSTQELLGIGQNTSPGFTEGLEIIAPGDCIILAKDDNKIEIEFDGFSQPEIGILDGYTMIIEGIVFDSSNELTTTNENADGETITFDEAIENKTIINVGDVIGFTGTEKIKIVLMDDKGRILSNVDDYMAPDIATVNSSLTEFSVTGTVLTEEEFTNCCLSYMNSAGIVNSDFSESNLREFYSICKRNAVNPEYAFVTAVSESSLTANEATSTHNYWGLDTPNGGSVPCLGTMLETLQIYCERLVEYQDPTSSYYSMIMERYEERSTCTENGGCNPNGYGKPNTLQGLQSIYSYVGDHVIGGSGTGGYYYLDPAVAGITAIYSTHEEFVAKCQNVHTYGTPTTVWEQAQYTAYQVETKIEKARSIFGDEAGRYML